MAVSKLSMITCIKPSTALSLMPDQHLSLAATAASTAADRSHRRTSLKEQQIPYWYTVSMVIYCPLRRTPKAICSAVGCEFTWLATMLPTINDGRDSLQSVFLSTAVSKLLNESLLLNACQCACHSFLDKVFDFLFQA